MARWTKIISHSIAIVLLLAAIYAWPQQNPKRLIMKDGSYQTATKWDIVGERVRYYSAERYDWEELPKDLVDWSATEKYNNEREGLRDEVIKDIAKADEADEHEAPLVVPGLRLPNTGGVFLFDNFKGQPQLVELAQNGGELNKHTGRNILRAAINPLALSSTQTIELKEPPPSHYGIVRVENKKDQRVVGKLNVAMYGKVSQKESWIPTTTSALGDWVKLTPSQPLPPGEYAVVELLDKKQINLFVWDFGVDPAAPANAMAWAPRPAGKSTGTNPAPALEKRPK
jgi:hypothetical protein